MSRDEIVSGAWRLDTATRRALRLTAARDAMWRRDLTRAAIEIEELLDEAPDDVEGLWTLAEIAADGRDFEVAREAWHALVAAGVDRAAVWTQLAMCAFEIGEIEEAIEACRRALALYADEASAHYILALCLERGDQPGHALTHFEQAHALAPLGHPLPLRLSDEEAADIVERALDQLSDEGATFWEAVPVRLAQWPELAEVRAPVPPISPRVLAMYEGPPPSPPDPEARPPSVRVFIGNLAHHETVEHAVDALSDALEHEFGDWRPPADEA